MGMYVGAAWSGKGWFGATVTSSDGWTYELYPTLWSLHRAHPDAEFVLIDVPIGLPEPGDGRRRCDEHAKRLLGPRHSSVFYTPVRPAVYERSLARAKEVNEAAGYSIQNQAWSLVPRIREVDEFLDAHSEARDRFRETHPEVCYHALHGAALDQSPNSASAVEERLEILRDVAPDAAGAFRDAVETYTQPRFAPLVTEPIDILDGFVAAITARRFPDVATLPRGSPTDGRGLPMEIVYPGDDRQLTLGDLGAIDEN